MLILLILSIIIPILILGAIGLSLISSYTDRIFIPISVLLLLLLELHGNFYIISILLLLVLIIFNLYKNIVKYLFK
uniref:Uncharacterized protein n=1 Tax=Acidianus brierleyi TaxID=41673 RepID=A0A2U9IBV2_9CREN